MFSIVYKTIFKKEVKKAIKSGKNLDKFKVLVKLLINNEILPKKYDNHKLHGEYVDCWECKLEPDWLVIYRKNDIEIIFIRMGTHSELFK